jgi:hypothetical protein
MFALAEDDHRYQYLSVAVGCFHFGAREGHFDGNAATHVAAIQDWLDRLEAVSNARVVDPEISWWENDLPPGLKEGGRPYPAITRLQIDFDLAISPTAQERLAFFGATREPMNVRVSIRQGPAVPIVFVVPDAARHRPNLAFSLAFATLEELIPPDAPFFLDSRGPSPAFLEFFLVPFIEPDQVPQQGWPFLHSRVDQPIGMNYEVFAYDPRMFDTPTEAAAALFPEIALLAGVYYEVIGVGRRLALEWHDLDELRAYLLHIEGRTGIRAWARRHLSRSYVLRELTVSLTEFEAEIAEQQARFAEIRRDMDAALAAPAMLPEIDEALREEFRFPTASIERPLQLFEQRRLTSVQNAAAVIGAVLAGVIGVSAALLLSQPTVTVQLQSTAAASSVGNATATTAAPPTTTKTSKNTTSRVTTSRTTRPKAQARTTR